MANKRVTTRLTAGVCNGIDEVISLQQNRTKSRGDVEKVAIVFMPILGGCCYFCCCCCPCTAVTMPNNFMGLVNNNGRYVGCMEQGESRNFMPWESISHVLYLGNVTYQWKFDNIKTKNDKIITVYGNTVFHIKTQEQEKSAYTFCYKLGPRGLDEKLQEMMKEAVKQEASKYQPGNTGGFQLENKSAINNFFQEFGVEIVSIDVEGMEHGGEYTGDGKNKTENTYKGTKEHKGENEELPTYTEVQQSQPQNVFNSLQDAMDITNKLAPGSMVPLVLTTLCNKVRELNGFDEEGIFRKSAKKQEIERLKMKLSADDYEIDTSDPHVVAGLLKDWLRGLNDALIPKTYYNDAIDMAKRNDIKHDSLEGFLSKVPGVNRESIEYLVKFLKELVKDEHVENTKMSVENVAIVFGPMVLKCPLDDPKAMMMNARYEKSFIVALIQELG